MTNELAVVQMLVIYKITCLMTGLCFAIMGYLLFIAKHTKAASEFEASVGGFRVELRKAGPGVFFSLFGAGLIAFTVYKGLEFDRTTKEVLSSPPNHLPEKPPTLPKRMTEEGK